ncbi:MAG: RNA polymerase sigma factor [Ferruginibacter sp.]
MNPSDKPDLFIAVIQANKGIIYKVANSYCNNAANRKDLVQEITVQLWKSFNNYTDQYKYSTWIYRIALNTAISFYRKENRRKEVPNDLSGSILDMVDTNNTGELEEKIGLLQQFISGLKELDRALMLLYLEEKSQKEIAEIIGISETNVATKVNRIKKLLKQKFSTVKT